MQNDLILKDLKITPEINTRLEQLKKIQLFLEQQESHIMQALYTDLRKSPTEAYLSEIAIVKHELKLLIKNLKKWTKPQKYPTPLFLKPAKSYTIYEPLGNILIISPWNYPLQLTLSPLIGSIAAGNATVLKPSEYAPATAQLLADLLPNYLTPNTVKIMLGGPELAQSLTQMPFDHIFFTGSTSVAKHIATAAAPNLTPLTLELGGKSPVIFDDVKNIQTAANRIIWGKTLNAGQTCIAPDYILTFERHLKPLTNALISAINTQLTDNPLTNPNYPKIISAKHFQRLTNYLEQQNIVHGGKTDPENNLIEPTIILNPTPDSPLHTDEIFGPILPIITVNSPDEALQCIKSKPKPLSLYIFADDPKTQQFYLQSTSSGGTTINDTIIHVANPHLPFGGVGFSGYGKSHAFHTFERLSNNRAIVRQTTCTDPSFRYPPFSPTLLKWLKRFF